MFSEHSACIMLKIDSDVCDFDVRASFIGSSYSTSRLYHRCVCVCVCVYGYIYVCVILITTVMRRIISNNANNTQCPRHTCDKNSE